MLKQIILFLFISLIQVVLSQNTYYQMENGVIVDSLEYVSFKAEATKQIKENNQNEKVRIQENFKEIKRTKDSLIYSASLGFEIGELAPKVQPKSLLDSYLGKELPLPKFIALNGDTILMKNLLGKPTFISFWYTKCAPCIQEMPVLNKLKEKLTDEVNFLAITFETNDKTKEFLSTHVFNFIQIPNARDFIQDLNLVSYPTNIILDKNGKLHSIHGPIPYVMDENYKMAIGDGGEFYTILKELTR